MASEAVATVVKMMESLPVSAQSRGAEHLRDYLADIQDELRWDATFQKTRPMLVAAARRARQEIAEGNAQPLNLDEL
jgi:hypothetical protein